MFQNNLFGEFLGIPTNPSQMANSKMSFDLARGQANMIHGMDAAATYRKGLLERAKTIAHKLASDGRTITIDDVVEALAIASDAPGLLGNASGSVFAGKMWECVGWRKSTRVSNHARSIRVWRLK